MDHAGGRILAAKSGQPLLDPAGLRALQEQAAAVPVSEVVAGYITALCQSLRRLAAAEHAVSVRASLAILRAARAHAFLEGAAAVFPDHVQAVFRAVMRHRVLPDEAADVPPMIEAALHKTPVP